MTASKPATPRFYGETDFAKLDAQVVRPHEYDELPELTDEMIEGAEFRVGEKLVRRGRPKLDSPKKLISLRVNQAALDAFRATGAGWQTRLNDAIVKAWKTIGRE